MPEFEGSGFGAAEKEWGKELTGEKEKREMEIIALETLKKVKEEYNADPWQIPIEDYDDFLEAAQFYLETADTDPDFHVDEKLILIAEDVIEKAPMEVVA